MYGGMGDPCHCGCPYFYVSSGITSSSVFLPVFQLFLIRRLKSGPSLK
jgi:hypothetical protein